MSYFINNQQKLNDIVFALRNKNYGAYELRSRYGHTLFISISFMMFSFVSIMGIAYYFSNHQNDSSTNLNEQIIEKNKVYVITTHFKPLEPLEKSASKPPSPKPSSSNQNNLNTNTIVSDTVINELAVNTNTETFSKSLSFTNTFAGTGSDSLASTGDEKTDKSNNKNNIKKDIEVDTAPEFEGGLQALYRFISRNLKYPSDAIEAGEEGTIRVKFVVDEKGEIGDLSLLNKKGFGLNEEALRVAALIPKFKSPAKIKGEAVKVYFLLPIKFKLQ